MTNSASEPTGSTASNALNNQTTTSQSASDAPTLTPPSEQAAARVGQEPSASAVREGSRVVIIGGGPGGYEAATVATRLGAKVTLVEHQGLGGAAVLTDVVPSKTLIATAEWLTETEQAAELGIHVGSEAPQADLAEINERVRSLAFAQSSDIRTSLEQLGVNVIDGVGTVAAGMCPDGSREVRIAHDWSVAQSGDFAQTITADVILIATGARPRALPGSEFDGKRILSWAQL